MGLRWRNVRKAQPQKKSAETEAMLAHIEKKTRRPRPRPASNACVALVTPPGRLGTSPGAASRVVSIGRGIMTWAGTSKIFPVGLGMKPGRGCASPLGALARPASASLMPSTPGGRRWRRPSRRPCPGGRAQWITVQKVVGSARSFCTAWCSLPPRWASPSTCCMTRPSIAHTIPLNGVGGVWNCPGRGRSWSMSSPG
jgi:hypothetical protein